MKEFVAPEIELVDFEVMDVITTSTPDNMGDLVG